MFLKFGCSHSLSKEIDSGSQKKGIIDLSTVSRVLGRIYSGRGEEEKTIHHPEKALGIATNFEWPTQLSQTSSSLAWLSFSPRRRRVQRRCPRPHFAGQDARSIMCIAMVTISGRASGQDLQEPRGGWGSGCQQSSPSDVGRKSGYLWRIGFQR